MSGLSSAQFVAYAREQIRTADVILDAHTAHGTMCSCGRTLPCSVTLTITRRRAHYVHVLARVVTNRAIGRARVRPGT